MTDEATTPNGDVDEATTPNGDVFEQLVAAGDAAMPALLQRIQSAVEGGGKVSRRHRCSKCGTADTIEVEVADVEEMRKLVEMFTNLRIRAQQAQKGDDRSAAAVKLLRDRSEMTDTELAEYIAELEASLTDDA